MEKKVGQKKKALPLRRNTDARQSKEVKRKTTCDFQKGGKKHVITIDKRKSCEKKGNQKPRVHEWQG